MSHCTAIRLNPMIPVYYQIEFQSKWCELFIMWKNMSHLIEKYCEMISYCRLLHMISLDSQVAWTNLDKFDERSEKLCAMVSSEHKIGWEWSKGFAQTQNSLFLPKIACRNTKLPLPTQKWTSKQINTHSHSSKKPICSKIASSALWRLHCLVHTQNGHSRIKKFFLST